MYLDGIDKVDDTIDDHAPAENEEGRGSDEGRLDDSHKADKQHECRHDPPPADLSETTSRREAEELRGRRG